MCVCVTWQAATLNLSSHTSNSDKGVKGVELIGAGSLGYGTGLSPSFVRLRANKLTSLSQQAIAAEPKSL